jgi:hypothetical protein
MGTLRKAREEGKLRDFVAEREDQAAADAERFEAILNSMAGKSKSEPETSPQDSADD